MKKHKRTKKNQHKVHKNQQGVGVVETQGEHEETQDKIHEKIQDQHKY